ncbi:hypothetical protein CAPTEDRAFT_226262 [Capitella teleta]|uniref:ARID domain-containing protein n=1 Tax=Capitella teleta TaxID=283909 RepID=R7TNI5_CAPTE|nr:hypothetical protein CAPTEDRAFT_226262 [Capitella teleta]|eukprot:ELT95418.1 hypothetical protein CAPTEDRAFT_226262 [Capitella teleta]
MTALSWPENPLSSSSGVPVDDAASNSSSDTGAAAAAAAAAVSNSGPPPPISHPAPPPQQQRPVPSPAGSNSSRCNTPGSVSGNQGVGSPMPPRPPASGQLDGQSRIQSPMANQGGYAQHPHMMPPGRPMGPGGMGPYSGQGNKMMSMMNMQQPQHYNAQYQQGNFNRGPPGAMPFGGRPGSPYGSSAGQSGGPPMSGMYGQPPNHNMHMAQGMPASNFPSQYPQQSMNMGQHGQQPYGYNPGPAGPMAAPSHSPAPAPGNGSPAASSASAPQQSKSPGCDSSSSGPSSPGPKGAKAAAQAALMAANQQQSSGKSPSSGSAGSPPPAAPSQGSHLQSMNQNRMAHPYMNHHNNAMHPQHPMAGGYSMQHSGGMHDPMAGRPYPGAGGSFRGTTNMHNMSGGGLVSANPVPSNLAHNSSLNAMNSMAASMSSGMPPISSYSSSSGPPPAQPPPPDANSNSSTGSSSSLKDMAASSSSSSSSPPPPPPCSSSDANDAKLAESVATVSSHSGDSGTSVTQSINMPLTNPMESKQAMSNVRSSPVPPYSPVPQGLKPPTPLQQQQQQQENGPHSVESNKGKSMDNMKDGPSSMPPTPASQIAPSPGPSTHNDDFENISSPSWPGTPKAGAGQNDAFSKLCEMGDEPDRRPFLERLFSFMEEKNAPISVVPAISKQPVDLFRLYFLVKEKGGLVDVTKNKKWRDVSGALNIGASSSAGFTLRKNYTKYLFPFECRFDLGNADPHPILASLETPSKKDNKRGQPGPNQDPYGRPMGPQGPYYDQQQRPPMGPQQPGQAGPMMPPNVSMMPNANMPYDGNGIVPGNMMNQGGAPMMPNQGMMMPNQAQMHGSNMRPPPRPIMTPNRETVAVQDPFSDAPAMNQQYPRPAGPMQQHQFNPNMSHPNMSQAVPGQPPMPNQFGFQRPPGNMPPSSTHPGPMGFQQQQPAAPPPPPPPQGPGPNQEVGNFVPPTTQHTEGGPGYSGQVPINRVPNQFTQPPVGDSKFDSQSNSNQPSSQASEPRPPSQCSSTGSQEFHGTPPNQQPPQNFAGRFPSSSQQQPLPTSSPAPPTQPPMSAQSSANRQTPTPNSSNSRSGTPLDQAATPGSSSTPNPQQTNDQQMQRRPSSAFSQDSRSPMPQPSESTTPTPNCNAFGQNAYPGQPPQPQSQMGQGPSQMGQGPPTQPQMGQGSPQMGQGPPPQPQMGQGPPPQPQMGQGPPPQPQMGQGPPHMGQGPQSQMGQGPAHHPPMSHSQQMGPQQQPPGQHPGAPMGLQTYPGQKGMYPQQGQGQQQQPKMFPGNDYRSQGNYPMHSQGNYGMPTGSSYALTPPADGSGPALVSSVSAAGAYTGSSSSTSALPIHQQPYASYSYAPPGDHDFTGQAMTPQQWSTAQQHRGYPMTSTPGTPASYGNTSMSGMSPAANMAASQANGPANPYSPMHPGRNARMPGRMDPKSPYPAVASSAPSAMGVKMTPQPSQPRSSGPGYGRKDLVFPPDSVEAAQPHYGKKQRLTHKHLKEKVDPWRLMMALRSGLLAESTWALDVLTVLLYDDSTVMWFGLQNLPGLLDVLLDHFRQCLIYIFGPDFEDVTVNYDEQDPAPLGLELTDEMKQQEAATLQQLKEIYEQDCKELDQAAQSAHQPSSKRQSSSERSRLLLQEQTRSMKDVKVKIEKLDADVVNRATGSSSSDRADDDDSDDDKAEGSLPTAAASDLIKKEPLKPCKLFDTLPARLIKNEKKAPRYRSPESGLLKDSRNFTYHTRSGKAVKIEIGSKDHLLALDERAWNNNRQCSAELLDNDGVTCESSYINIHFEHANSLSFSRRQFFKRAKKTPTKLQAEDLNLSVSSITSDKENSAGSKESAAATGTNSTASCDAAAAAPTASSSAKSPEHSHSQAAAPPCDSSDCAVSSPPAPMLVEEPCSPGNHSSPQSSSEQLTAAPTLEGKDTDVDNLKCLKRKWRSETELEAYQLDPGPLTLQQESNLEVSRRCLCLSNILRSLSFIPTNGGELSRHSGLMQVLGRLLLLNHRHPKRQYKRPPSSHIRICDDQIFIDDDLPDVEGAASAPVGQEEPLPFDYGQKEWWWETLCILREDMLVTLANVSGHLNLNTFPEEICMPVLDGLLHWAVCPAACARDPLPTCGHNSVLSPHRLVLESLCKLCVTETNVDLLLATPPFSRMVSLLSMLVKLLADRAEQVMREFAIVLLSSLVQGESGVPRIIALQQPSISLLLDFIESAEMQAMQIVNSHGVMMLQDNPEMMGTSLDMLRRAAVILEHLAQVPENRSLLLPHQQRILHLVMSQFLDQHVATILSEVLYFCSQAEADTQAALPPTLTSGLAL